MSCPFTRPTSLLAGLKPTKGLGVCWDLEALASAYEYAKPAYPLAKIGNCCYISKNRAEKNCNCKQKRVCEITDSFFVCGCWWIRTTEVERQQIYSLPHLATLENTLVLSLRCKVSQNFGCGKTIVRATSDCKRLCCLCSVLLLSVKLDRPRNEQLELCTESSGFPIYNKVGSSPEKLFCLLRFPLCVDCVARNSFPFMECSD